MRERGLKPPPLVDNGLQSIVAPHAGAWIETDAIWSIVALASVAPHAGAWIETNRPVMNLILFFVAPHAGAWIETTKA